MKRHIDQKLVEWKSKKGRKALIVLGARQIGKTYSLESFAKKEFPNYLYINFERRPELKEIFEFNLEPSRLIKDLETQLKTSINIKTDLLILDEIQECPKALTSLKYFNEDMPELAVCSAGSLLGIKVGEGSFPVGKVEFLDMHPMSFFEFLEAINENNYLEYLQNWQADEKIPAAFHKEIWDKFKYYLIVGGLPEAVKAFKNNLENLNSAFEEVRNVQETLIRAYLADIAKYSGKQNSMHIERVWTNVPNQLNKEQDGTAAKYRFTGVLPKTKGYERLAGPINWLLATNLAIKVPIINSGELPSKAYITENRFKLFVFDVGILTCMSQLSALDILKYDYGTYKGYIAENFIAQEFLSSSTKPNEIFAWKENTAELEFLRTIDSQVIPIEVKSGFNTRSKSIKIFMQRYKPSYGAIFSAKNFGYDAQSQIYRYPIYTAARFPIVK